jgi:hypothetical protein
MNDPLIRLANGLALAMAASRELDPRDAANTYPEDMPLLTDDVTRLHNWLGHFEEEFRALCGAGNDVGRALP